MDLDPQIAETIVSNLKDIIQHEINLFDTTGTIIASTDRSRIGTSHDGARLAISTQNTVSIDSEHEFKGAKHGINVPVLFNGAPVAVIGITGERSEVEPFGNVIKKMTEILIRENWEQITRFDQRTRLASLVGQLCLPRHDPGLVDYLASVLDIDLSLPRLAVVGHIASRGEKASSESPYQELYAYLRDFPNSFFSAEGDICLFVEERDGARLPGLLRVIKSTLEKRLHLRVVFGVGDLRHDQQEYWKSYEEACKAADWLLFRGGDGMARYDELDYGIFISSIPRDEAEKLERRVFGDLSDEEIEAFERVFAAYTAHNGSIAHAADELFLHKNTLQNRLNKIARETGYNPRELSDHTVLALAFLLRRYERFTEKRASSKDGALEEGRGMS